MISPAEAANKVKEKIGSSNIVRVKDYDAKHYVVEALPGDGKRLRGNPTTYGVDKRTGEVTRFDMRPFDGTLDKFLSAKELPFK